MQWRHGWLAAMLVACFAGAMPVNAAQNPLGAERRVQVDLLASARDLQPGGRVTIAIRQTIEPGWHTYWINPGDSGEPTAVDWTLPAGFEASPLRWPLPHAIPTGPLTNYGYEGTVLLLSDLTLPPQLPSGDIRISGKVRYLVCKDICIPEEADVSLTFGPGHAPAGAAAIARSERDLPVALPGVASYAAPSPEKLLLAASVPGLDLSRVKGARFFPFEWGHISNPAEQPFRVNGERIEIELMRGEAKTTPSELRGVLALTEEVNGVEQRQGFELAAILTAGDANGGAARVTGADAGAGAITGPGANSAAGQSGSGGTPFTSISLPMAALFAFLGGLILNLMPCVFPVLALKALSFAKGAQGEHIRQGGAYFAGVMVSFAVFAGALLFLRETGQALGWGFQFQSPEFVLALAALFFALGLSLSGVFSFGGGLMAAGDSLARKPGNAGYFFTGVLAAVAATPCTAPFMGAAIGYALAQPPLLLFVVFFALGAGFALPVVLLSLSPAFQRLLPKPGAWMETFKQVMAFPLYATAGWLIWVLSIQSGSDGVLAAAVALVGVGFAAWLAGRTAMSSLPSRLAAPALALVAVISAFTLTPDADPAQPAATAAAQENGGGPKWETFTAARLDELVQSGQPVFVNFTAAWCITCKVNERVALSSETIADAFARAKITYLKGDWTRQNPEITAVLQRFGRAGVPLYLFFPGNGQDPRVLPQLLTESIVLDEIATPSNATTATTKGA